MYEIVLIKRAKKELKKLDKHTQENIISVLERIRIRPQIFLTKLVGEEGYKLRVGKYRILIDLQKQKFIVLVLKIAHRKKVYKKS